jgi:hypothetical protein
MWPLRMISAEQFWTRPALHQGYASHPQGRRQGSNDPSRILQESFAPLPRQENGNMVGRLGNVYFRTTFGDMLSFNVHDVWLFLRRDRARAKIWQEWQSAPNLDATGRRFRNPTSTLFTGRPLIKMSRDPTDTTIFWSFRVCGSEIELSRGSGNEDLPRICIPIDVQCPKFLEPSAFSALIPLRQYDEAL